MYKTNDKKHMSKHFVDYATKMLKTVYGLDSGVKVSNNDYEYKDNLDYPTIWESATMTMTDGRVFRIHFSDSSYFKEVTI
jgi:hypothetical protein